MLCQKTIILPHGESYCLRERGHDGKCAPKHDKHDYDVPIEKVKSATA